MLFPYMFYLLLIFISLKWFLSPWNAHAWLSDLSDNPYKWFLWVLNDGHQLGPIVSMSLLIFVILRFGFWLFLFFHPLGDKKKVRRWKFSSFIPFPLQTLTSEESTLDFYNINDASFIKEFDDFSDGLFIYHKPLMIINARENTMGFMRHLWRYFVSLLRKGVWRLRWWAPSRKSLF